MTFLFTRSFLKAFAVLFVFATFASGCAISKKNVEEAELRNRIGSSYLSTGNFPNALRELLEAERLDPDNAIIQNNLGLVYFFRSKFDTAAEKFKRATELNPSYSEARNNYARTLIEQTRYDQAIIELKKVTDDLTYGDPAKAWINLGLAYFRKGDYSTAKDRFSQAVQINRENCLGQTFLGRSMLELGQLPNAATALDNAVVICRKEKFEEPSYFSGLTYYKLGRTSSAIARMEEVVKINPHGQYAKKAESMLKLMK